MQVLDNVATQDKYVGALTLEAETADTLTYVIGNASVYASLRPVAHHGGADPAYGPDLLITPTSNTIRNVSGARFRSAVAGTPARVIAQLTGPQDPQLGAGSPYTQQIAASGAVGDVLTGTVFEYAGSAPPVGYLLCDGSAVSRTTYAALFGVISTIYGVGDGSTTFNIPDLGGRVVVGLGTHADVDALGKNDGVALAANRRPKHRHTAHTHPVSGDNALGTVGNFRGGTGVRIFTGATDGADGGSGNVNDSVDAPAYLVLNRIIKT